MSPIKRTNKKQKTSKQNKAKSISYKLIASILAVLLVISLLFNFYIVNVSGVRAFVNNLPMFSWHFSLTSLVICLPVILVIILIIPTATYRRLRKVSVVDRLRNA